MKTLTVVMSKQEALELTRAIVEQTEGLWELLHKAYEGGAWKALGYDSWREYAVVEFKVSQRRAYELLNFAKVQDALCAIAQKPTHESQVRPLAPLSPAQQREAWQAAVEVAPNGKPTAKEVEAAVEAVVAPSRAGGFDAGVYPFKVPDKYNRLDAYRAPGPKKTKTGRKGSNLRHYTRGIRTVLGSTVGAA